MIAIGFTIAVLGMVLWCSVPAFHPEVFVAGVLVGTGAALAGAETGRRAGR